MRQDFVDKLELELRAAGERRARPWRIARRQLLTPALAALGVLAIAIVVAATVLRSEDTIPAQAPPRLIADTALVSQGGSMASAFGSVWVADIARERLLRLDPRTRAIEARIPLGGEAWVDAAAGSVWALGSDRLLRIDPSTNRVVASIPTGGQAGVVLEGRGVVWLGNPQALRRVDLRRNAITRTVPTSREGFKALDGVSDGRILYVVRGDQRLLRFDARTGKRLSAVRAPVGRRPRRRRRHGVPHRRVGRVGGRRRHRPRALDARPPRAADQQRHPRRHDAVGARDDRATGATGCGVSTRAPATSRARSMLPEFGASGLVAAGKQVWTMSTGGDLQVALGKG